MLYKTGSLADFFQNSRKALVNARDDKNIYTLIVEYNLNNPGLIGRLMVNAITVEKLQAGYDLSSY